MEERLSGLHRGTVVHGVLADVYRALMTEGLTPLERSGLPRAGELLRHHLERRLSRMASMGSPGELRLLGWEVSRLAWGLLAFDAERGGPSAPLELEYALPSDGVDLGGIRISGRIDRVDAPPGGSPVFVIDYKSGSQAYGPRFAEKRALQVPLYLAALRVLRPEVEVAGGAYAALGGLTVRGAVRADMAPQVGGWLSEKCYVDQAELRCRDRSLPGHRPGWPPRASGGAVIPAEPDGECRSWCTFRPICRTHEEGGQVELTKEQLGAVEAKEPRVFVAAGAGTGKTSLLVARYLRALLHDGLGVEDLPTVTFTRKAAAEMKSRIRSELLENGSLGPGVVVGLRSHRHHPRVVRFAAEGAPASGGRRPFLRGGGRGAGVHPAGGSPRSRVGETRPGGR